MRPTAVSRICSALLALMASHPTHAAPAGSECFEWAFTGQFNAFFVSETVNTNYCFDSVQVTRDSGAGTPAQLTRATIGWAPDRIIECSGVFLGNSRTVVTGNQIDTYRLTSDGKLSRRSESSASSLLPSYDCDLNTAPDHAASSSQVDTLTVDLLAKTIEGGVTVRGDEVEPRYTTTFRYDSEYRLLSPLSVSKTPVARPPPMLEVTIENPLWPNAGVDRVAADGETEVVVHIRSNEPGTVSLVITTPSKVGARSLISLTDGSVTLEASEDPDYPFSARRALTITAPGWDDFKAIPALIDVAQDDAADQVTFSIQAPPVAVIHGIWSSPSTWEQIGHIPTFLPIADITLIDYTSVAHLNFARDPILSSVLAQLRARRIKLSRGGLAFTRFNAIGHSMGALIARTLPRERTYYRPDNRGLGDLRFLVSIGSPMEGSPLAERLAESANETYVPVSGEAGTQFELVCELQGNCGLVPTKLAAVMALLDKEITCGLQGGPDVERCAVHALSPGSTELNQLAPPATLPFVGIRGVAPETSREERVLGALLVGAGAVPPGLNPIDTLLGANHDTIVSIASQNAGAASQTDISNLIHAAIPVLGRLPSETNDTRVMRAAACYLGGLSACTPPLVSKARQYKLRASVSDDLYEVDLSAMEDVTGSLDIETVKSPGTVDVTLTPASGAIQTVYYQVGASELKRVFGSPATFQFNITSDTFQFSGIALLDGDRYARFGGTGNALLPTMPVLLVPTTKLLSLERGRPVVWRVNAVFGSGVSVDVTRAVSTTHPDGVSLVSFSDGIITPHVAGTGSIRVTYDQLSIDIPVTVTDENALFGNGFE